MRRLWAYIVTAFTALVLMGTTFTDVFAKVDSNIEYKEGKEIVFRITEKDKSQGEFDDDTAVKNIAAKMEERLKVSGISRYEVATEGLDTVKATFAASPEEYDHARMLLSFNGSLALTTNGEEVALGSEFLTDSPAYVSDINGYPTVVIPVNTDNAQFKSVIEAAKKQQEEIDKQPAPEGEDAQPKEPAYVYLWCDYVVDYDSFDKTQQTLPDGSENPEYDPKVAEKIVMSFPANDLYFPDELENKLAAAVELDKDGDGTVTPTEMSKGYANARYYVNLLNAGELDYKVTYMYTNEAPAWTEELKVFGSNQEYVAMSRTVIAFLCAIAIISLLLIVFYKLGALSVITSTIASVFAGIGFIVLFSVKFNGAAVMGLVMVALASIISGIIYLTKLKEEAYKGRSLKKANNEAAKKSLLPIVDVNVVVIVIGAFAYLLGGVIMEAFSAATVLGGLISLVMNTLVLRILMWLPTNATALTGKYDKFGIEPDKVPNIIAEEKQTYFGPYDGKDFTKKKKPLSIVMGIAFVASLAGMITFGVVNNGNIYNPGSLKTENSQIIFETTVNKGLTTKLSTNLIEDLADDLFIHFEDNEQAKKDAKPLSSMIVSIDDYVTPDKVGNKEIETYYFVATLNNKLTSEAYGFTKNVISEDNVQFNDSVEINEALLTLLSDHSIVDPKVGVKEITVVSADQPTFAPITLAVSVAVMVLSIYIFLRYGISKALSTLLLTFLTSGVTLGIFSLTRIVVPTYTTVALPLIAAFTLILAILYMNREKEMVSEDRNRTNTLEYKKEMMVKATSSAFGPMIISMIFAIYLAINFYGFGPAATGSMYIMSSVGIVLATLIVSTLCGPLANLFYGWFSKVKINHKPRKNKKGKKVIKNKSAEPEEAIFIGIND